MILAVCCWLLLTVVDVVFAWIKRKFMVSRTLGICKRTPASASSIYILQHQIFHRSCPVGTLHCFSKVYRWGLQYKYTSPPDMIFVKCFSPTYLSKLRIYPKKSIFCDTDKCWIFSISIHTKLEWKGKVKGRNIKENTFSAIIFPK